jgi:cation transport ATPase
MATENKSPRPVAVKPPPVSDETVQLLLQQQARETEVRRAELDLRAQELRNNSAHAEKILGAQERDREAERRHERSKAQYRLWFAGFCVLMLVGLVVGGMYLNKDQLVGDILKVLAGAIAGALGGYGYAQSKPPKQTEDP